MSPRSRKWATVALLLALTGTLLMALLGFAVFLARGVQ